MGRVSNWLGGQNGQAMTREELVSRTISPRQNDIKVPGVGKSCSSWLCSFAIRANNVWGYGCCRHKPTANGILPTLAAASRWRDLAFCPFNTGQNVHDDNLAGLLEGHSRPRQLGTGSNGDPPTKQQYLGRMRGDGRSFVPLCECRLWLATIRSGFFVPFLLNESTQNRLQSFIAASE